METWIPLIGIAVFALAIVFFANGVVNVYLSSAQKPLHRFIANEAILKAIIALLGLGIGAMLKNGTDMTSAQWELKIFQACVIAGAGALIISLFNQRLIVKARGNTSGHRGAALSDLARRNRIRGMCIPSISLLLGFAGMALASNPPWRSPLAFLGTSLIIFCAVVPGIITKVASKYALDLKFGV